MKPSSQFFCNFFIVFVLTILAKLASFFTELTVAKFLGTSSEADAYSMVFGVHYIIYPMLGVGLWKAFMPEYGYLLVKEGKVEATKFANIILNYTLIVGFCATIAIMYFSDSLVKIVAPGFDVETRIICSNLIFISAPQYFFVLLAAFCSAILQSQNKFFASNFKEIVTYSPIIFFAYYFYEQYGLQVFALGIVVGAVLRLAVQIPFIKIEDYRLFDFELTRNVKNVLNKMPSLLLTTAVTDLNIFITKSIASMVCIGAVSSLSYGERISNVITGLTAGVISVVIFPQLTKFAAMSNYEYMSKTIKKYSFSLVLIILPGLTVLYVFAFDIVKLLFMRGAFDINSALVTSGIFRIYIYCVVFSSIKMILLNGYYAIGNTRIPLLISMFILTLNGMASMVLPKYYGIYGLAIANVACSIIECVVLLFILNFSIKMNFLNDYIDYFKIAVFALFCYYTLNYIKSFLIFNVYTVVIIACFIYLLYFTLLRYMDIKCINILIIQQELLYKFKNKVKIYMHR